MVTPQLGSRLTVFGEPWSVAEELGRGGEGAVYAVHDGSDRRRFALKWYFSPADWRRDLLAYLVDRGSPTDRFLWPLAIIEARDGTFGYVMHLRPDGYASLADLLRGRVERREDRVLRFGLDLASSFLALHGAGLCYRDINFGNAFYDPTNGRALICDNDNVGIDGVSRSGVRGAPQFMAPEIVREETLPSRVTDQHSLAVMLYYLLMVGHPLEGGRTWNVVADGDAHRRFFGVEPLFAFDPDDHRNRPDPISEAHVIERWERLPSSLRNLFLRAFTVGLHDPELRVQDSEWCRSLRDASARLWRCQRCGRDSYAEHGRTVCGGCGTAMPGWVKVNGSELAISELLEVTRAHVGPDGDDLRPVGIAEAHPGRAGVIGLRNATAESWHAVDPVAGPQVVPPGRRVRLLPGTTVDIGGVPLGVYGTWAGT